MVALRHRDRTGEGQVIDVNLLESMLQCMGALPSVWAHRGELQPRLGSGIPYTVPRGTYRCADGCGSPCRRPPTPSPGAPALIGVDGDERFGTFVGRMEHWDELEGRWPAG
jgi:crotonobetainyl-CoA:carnitine CoA-transferase CaiB-like acyl-CoA transferase